MTHSIDFSQPNGAQEMETLLDAFKNSKDRFLTGFDALDQCTGGLVKGGLTLIASRPGMGRSSFALNIIHQIAQQQTGNILLFTSQLSPQDVVMRLLSIGLDTAAEHFVDGTIPPEELTRRFSNFFSSRKGSLRISYNTNPSLRHLWQVSREVPDLRLLIVDDIQYICKPIDFSKAPETWGILPEDRERVITSLKDLAEELQVPVLCISHLSRSLESRKNKRPKCSDLAATELPIGSLDQVLFLYRDRYYNPESDDTAECIVAKNSHGDTGTIATRWDMRTGKFHPLPQD